MNKKEKKWLLVILAIGFVAYFFPYTVLSHVAMWYGSFLLWFFVGIGVIVVNIFITKDWGG